MDLTIHCHSGVVIAEKLPTHVRNEFTFYRVIEGELYCDRGNPNDIFH